MYRGLTCQNIIGTALMMWQQTLKKTYTPIPRSPIDGNTERLIVKDNVELDKV